MSRVNQLIAERQGGLERGTLFIASEKLTDEELAALLEDNRVPLLVELTLHHNSLSAASARTIASSSKMKALQSLDVSFNAIGDEGVKTLARATFVGSLATLSLAAVGAGGTGIKALVDSPHAAKVPELALGFQNIGPAASGLTSPRKKLSLQKAGIDGATAVALLRTAQVEALVLTENPISDLTGLDHLSPSIVSLELRSCELTDLAPLASAAAPGLLALALDYNSFGDAGLNALARAPWLSRLQSLSVMGAKGSASGRQALRGAWGDRPGLTIER